MNYDLYVVKKVINRETTTKPHNNKKQLINTFVPKIARRDGVQCEISGKRYVYPGYKDMHIRAGVRGYEYPGYDMIIRGTRVCISGYEGMNIRGTRV